jgi:hypothetical protein
MLASEINDKLQKRVLSLLSCNCDGPKRARSLAELDMCALTLFFGWSFKLQL